MENMDWYLKKFPKISSEDFRKKVLGYRDVDILYLNEEQLRLLKIMKDNYESKQHTFKKDVSTYMWVEEVDCE